MWRLKLSVNDDPWLKSVNDHIGREFWEFDPNLGTPEERSLIGKVREEFRINRFQVKHSSDLLMRMQFAKENACEMKLPLVKIRSEEKVTEEAVEITLRKALRFYSTLQAEDGHWPGDYGGPLFLLPGLIIGLYVMGALETILSEEHQREIHRYIFNHQNSDGGWGLHIEGRSTMFCTALNYVSLRLLGEQVDGGGGHMEKARKWILNHGGVTFIPSWGKFWLSVLGVYDWSGINPLPPELWLLPYFLPFHPGRMWCHYRMVYLPMAYLYGKRYVGTVNATALSLRTELYEQPYHLIDWNLARNQCAKEDLYYPHTWLQNILWTSLHKVAEPFLMKWPFSKLRQRALRIIMQHIHYEDENTNYVCLGPVNKVLNMVCRWVEDENSIAIKQHLSRIKDYLWVAEDGMKMKAALLLSRMSSDFVGEAIEEKRLHLAVDVILSYQNSNGGIASYELTRSYAWLEMINPSEIFGEIIIDYPYIECTPAAVQGLKSFVKSYPSYRREEIEACINKALDFIESIQLPDGSW